MRTIKAVLFTDAKRTKTFGGHNEQWIVFNEKGDKVKINDQRTRKVNREFTKTVGRTQIRLWSTFIFGDVKVYFRETVLLK